MTPDEARTLLLQHAGHSASGDGQSGFLGMLRPYHGLRAENFHEVMQCLRVLAPVLRGPSIDRQLVMAVWSLCHLARAWGLDEDGMLRRNRIITDEDAHTLEGWVDVISWTVFWLIGEGSLDDAFSEYERRYPERR
jgi:hypothetical protein